MSLSRLDSFLQKVYKATGFRYQNELASAIGINPSGITQARKNDSVPAKWILLLYRKYGLNPDWLEEGVGPIFIKSTHTDGTEFRQVPKVKARLCAGGGSFEVGSEIEGYYSFRMDWLSKKGTAEKMVLLDIFGNSMEPEFREGDTVLIDESQKDAENWQRFPNRRSAEKHSYSQQLFEMLGLPQHKTDDSKNLTMHQILRLIYVDQLSATEKLLNADLNYDNVTTRRAIGEYLLGLDDLESHNLRQDLIFENMKRIIVGIIQIVLKIYMVKD